MFIQHIKNHLSKAVKLSSKRGEVLYREGESANYIYILSEGLIGLYHTSEGGKETFLRVFSSGYIFGHRSFFAAQEYHASAVTLTNSVVYRFSQKQFEEILKEDPALMRELISILAKELRNSELRLAGFQDKSASLRIIESLIFLKYRQPDYAWTRKEIADFSGSTFETVARVMTKLAEQGFLIKQGRKFTLENPEKMLEEFSEV